MQIDSNDYDRLSYFEDNFVGPTYQEMEEVFKLYQKYIDKNIWTWNQGCDCGNAIHKLYKQLMDWFKQNKK